MNKQQVVQDTDGVVAAVPLPSGGKLNSIHLSMRVLSEEDLPITDTVAYGVTGFVIPVLDPDTTLSLDAMWNLQVPKDVAVAEGAFDLDTATQVAAPEWEMGQPDLPAIMGFGELGAREIFRRRKFISFPDSNFGWQAGTPDTFLAVDGFTTQIKKSVSVNQPSMVMIGFSSPLLDVTGGTVDNIPSESEWTLLRYLDEFLIDAWKSLTGVITSGTQEVGTEMALFVADLLEQAAYEQDAGKFEAVTWEVTTKATFDISVPGRFELGVLSSE